MKMGLFVGLVTLDFIYLAEHLPTSNQKIVAANSTIAAGGPVTNAAVAFAHLGNSATLMGVVGCHPMTQLMRSDLAECGVNLIDLDDKHPEPPSVSSIIVTQKTGERAVVSVNATKVQVEENRFSTHILQDIDIVLIDGHQMTIGREIAKAARSRNIPVAIDGGSWKSGFETILPYTDYAICSANFQPPGCANCDEVFAYLQSFEIPHIAITRGERSILFDTEDDRNEIEVSEIEAIDTLGAGDIFHGAFCHFILSQSFTNALENSARIASRSCQFFGTRQWRGN